MTLSPKIIVLASTLLASAAAFAVEEHHPADPNAAQGTPPAAGTTAGQPATMGMGPGMMNGMGGNASGPGTMGGGMMGNARMPAGSADGMSMGGGMMPMMGMMGAMGDPDAMIERVEGRIAFVKVELKLTAQQLPLWDAFADTLRANAKAMNESMSAMMAAPAAPATLLERLGRHEKMLVAHLDSLRRTKGTLEPLYTALSAAQKETADALLFGSMAGPRGMM